MKLLHSPPLSKDEEPSLEEAHVISDSDKGDICLQKVGKGDFVSCSGCAMLVTFIGMSNFSREDLFAVLC